MKFISIYLHREDENLQCFSCKFELEGLGEVEMKKFDLSSQAAKQLEKELAMQIMQRLGRDFEEVFNEKEALHRTGNKAQNMLPLQEQSSAPVADMLGQQPISADMP